MRNAMRQSPIKVRRHTAGVLPCFVLLLLSLVSCRNDMEKVRLFDPHNLPQQNLDTVRAVRSLGGKKQMVLVAPKVVMYDHPERKTIYPDGIDMLIFGSNDKVTASIKAKYASSLDEKKIIEARKDVVIIDYRSGDTSYLNSIIWNSAEHRIFSRDTIKSVNGARVTYGDGFESDDEFTAPRILHQRGTMTFDE